MASPSLELFFFISTLSLSLGCHAFVLPVAKDPSTRQYLAEIHLGTSTVPIKLVVDLGGPVLWFDCSSSGYVSSSTRWISGTSNHCAKAAAHRLLEIKKIPQLAGYRTNAACSLLLRNGAIGLTASGELVEDIVAVGSAAVVQNLLFACAPQRLLHGLAGGAQGVLGLGKTQISLPSQLAAATGNQRRLTVYLSPSNGIVSTNSAEELFGSGVSRSLVYTPLLANPGGNYAINVKSIRINGEKLPIDVPLSAGLSTVVPYTMLESSIYDIFVEAYTKTANATKVKAIAPFRLCFAETTPHGSALPAVDMALQSEMVKWRMRRRNLMVDVGGGIGCLGVMDGGSGRPSPIVMGGLQLEGFVLDFDLGNSVMGFGRRAGSGSTPDSMLREVS